MARQCLACGRFVGTGIICAGCGSVITVSDVGHASQVALTGARPDLDAILAAQAANEENAVQAMMGLTVGLEGGTKTSADDCL